MAEIKEVKEIERIMRLALIENSGVDGNYVRNLITEFSADLDKTYTNSIFNGLSSDNVAILFELLSDNNSSDMSEDIYNSNDIAYYQYFRLKVIIYGDESTHAALRIISRLRSEVVRDELIGQGINVANISEVSNINEVINGVVWRRCDFDCLLGCKMIITPVKEAYGIQGYSTLSVYKK